MMDIDGHNPFLSPETYDLQISNCPSQDLAKTNCVFVSPENPAAEAAHLELGDLVFAVRADAAVPPGAVGLNAVQRRACRVSSGDRVAARAFAPPAAGFELAALHAEVDFVSKKAAKGPPTELDAADLGAHVLSRFAGQVLTAGQELTFEYRGTNFLLRVATLVAADAAAAAADGTDAGPLAAHRGLLGAGAALSFEAPHGAGIKLAGGRGGAAPPAIFRHKEFNFEKLGIGGLDAQFEQIFRRAFASRIFPPAVLERLGIQHVKGVLLHGPPGTGKTLIARQIGKMLNGREPKVVNGPEVLSKFVGESEENVRKLFAEAEADSRARGPDADLHVIIFDEIDAVCKARGSVASSAGVHDTVVNQLLTKIDGVDALNNILLIGMTNRKDMLDEALLRPGRLEVQVEIGLPDERGRLQILGIHTARMAAHSFLGRDVDLPALAARTPNFSGAEIEGLVKSAASFALNRQVDAADLTRAVDEAAIRVSGEDFAAALGEVRPAFGADADDLEARRLHGIVDYGPRFQRLLSSCRTLVKQVETGESTPLLTCLLEGPPGAGKTALAATLAAESGFPFVKLVSAEALVGHSEAAKCAALKKVFDDAARSPLSCVVLDEVERLLEYVAIGPRFSNAVLQTLLVLLKRAPPAGRRLFVVGTTSLRGVMEEMDVAATFSATLHVPALAADEARAVLAQLGAFSGAALDAAVGEAVAGGGGVPLKRLLLLLDLARQGLPEEQAAVPLERWTKAIQDLPC